MIDRQHDKIIYECDGCGTTLETGTSRFEQAREIFRAESWKAVPVGRGKVPEWTHYCENCKGSV